jgi:hypothetical protein
VELRGLPQCEDCRQASGFNPAFYNVFRTELSAVQQAYNAEPHNVYIVCFGHGLFKVGISNARRTLTRWREQGALVGCVLSEYNDAYAARAVETWLRTNLGIPEAVSQTAKLSALKSGPDLAMCTQELASYASLALSLLKRPATKSAEVLLREYCIQDIDLRLFGRMIDVGSEVPLAFDGRLVAIIGTLLIAWNNSNLICCSAKSFEGHLVRTNVPVSISLPQEQFDLL